MHAVSAEVDNALGEGHLYVLSDRNRQPAAAPDQMSYHAHKVLHVSPFVSMDAVYDFHFSPVAERLSIPISESEHGEHLVDSHLRSSRRELSDRRLAAVLVRYPLFTLRVTAAIHWHSLRPYPKGVPFFSQPAASPRQSRQLELMRQLSKEVTR